MAGAQPAINLPTPPGGHIYAGEAGLSIGSSPGSAPTGGSWTFSIAAADGIRDLTVGGLLVIRDGAFAPAALDLGYGTLSVTAYDPASGEVTVGFQLTGAYQSHPGAQQRYGDIVSHRVVLTDRDGDAAAANLLVQIRDDEAVDAVDDRAVATLGGGAVTGNLVAGETPDRFTADGFGGVFQVSDANGGSADSAFDAQGRLQVQGQYGTFSVGVAGDFTYTPRAGAPAGAVDHLMYHVRDGDGDADFAFLHVELKAGDTPPPSGGEGGQTLVSDQYADTLTGGAGADTLFAGQGPDQLTGAGGADVFAFRDLPWNAGVVTDFADGADRLDLTALYAAHGYAGSDPVADGWVRFESDGAGGTRVLFDTDGPGAAQSWPYLIATLSGVAPSALSAADLVGGAASAPADPGEGAPPAAGQTLVSDQYGDALQGGAGADTLIAGRGPDQLTGGAGGDRFVYADTPWNAGAVADFQPGVDRIDLSGIFDGMAYAGATPIADGYLSLQADGGSTRVFVDVDGPGGGEWPFLIATLTGVAPASLSMSDFIL
jgi:Ca2+-binding RTX toxin-like protein